MSLLDSPPHVVTVQPYARTPGRYGDEWAPAGEPVQVAGALQPSVSEEEGAESTGLTTDTRWLFITRSWPYGPHTRVTHEGQEYEQVGQARRYRMSTRTQHDDVVLRTVGADG